MKHLIISLMLVSLPGIAQVPLTNKPYGSGVPGNVGITNAEVVDNDLYHAPEYLPGYPTAAPIWPRVVEVKCTSVDSCEGYHWTPALGRGEYIYVTPKLIEPPPRVDNTTTVLVFNSQEPKMSVIETPVKKKIRKFTKPKVCK